MRPRPCATTHRLGGRSTLGLLFIIREKTDWGLEREDLAKQN